MDIALVTTVLYKSSLLTSHYITFCRYKYLVMLSTHNYLLF